MAWVDSEYAGEFAVLSTWIVALLPWSTSVLSIPLRDRDVTVVVIRFLYFRLQYVFGISLGGQERPFLLVSQAPSFNPAPLATASWAWVAAALASLVPVGLSVAYYLHEDGVSATIPWDVVRLQGALIAVVAALLVASTALFATGQKWTVPVGSLFAPVFAYLLLTVDRT